MNTISFSMEMDALGEVELDVEYTATIGRPAVNYLSNGDPGYPAEPAEISVSKVVTTNGIDLTGLLAGALNDYEPFLDAVGAALETA